MAAPAHSSPPEFVSRDNLKEIDLLSKPYPAVMDSGLSYLGCAEREDLVDAVDSPHASAASYTKGSEYSRNLHKQR